MESRWSDDGARAALTHWSALTPELALRLYSAQLLGEDPRLVLHGGGNCSVKVSRLDSFGHEEPLLYVKASGFDMATLGTDGMPALTLDTLRPLRELSELSDEDMVDQFRRSLCKGSSPTPSVETLLHAFLPHRYIDHTHDDALLIITNQPNGLRLVREVLGGKVAIIQYVRPGFALAKSAAQAYQADPTVIGLVLMNHGLVTFADDARTSYERHIELVDACERFIVKRGKPIALKPVISVSDSPATLAAKAAPMLRGMLAASTNSEDRPRLGPIVEWRGSESVLEIVNSHLAGKFASTGPLTPDHVLRTKPHALFIENPRWSEPEVLRQQIRESITPFEIAYREYLIKHGGEVTATDAMPRVVLLPGAGLFATGQTKRAASITADIAEQTLQAKLVAESIGTFQSLSPRDLYDIEFWPLERAKLKTAIAKPLAQQIVVISGAAGAIGSAVAEVCALAGAHVALTDIDAERLQHIVVSLQSRVGKDVVCGVPMDVTDEAGVKDGFEQIVRTFGGVDVVVVNAGIAHVAPIDELATDAFQQSLNVNTVGGLLFMREAIRILKEQGIGGDIIINSSKNVFAPGKDFAAYSASKAALHQLGKVAAIELAAFDIRVNMINADGIFGDEEAPSGLWKTVGSDRAKSRGLTEAELPEYYKNRNLLKARVTGRHVGNAIVFFASRATPTTGATLPIDGGLPEAFPR